MSKRTKKTAQQLQGELNVLKRSRLGQGLTALAQTTVRTAGMVVIAYFAYRSVAVLAGTTTLADINVGVKFLADMKVSESAAWLLTGLFGGYGWRQRVLRRDNIARLEGKIRQLETKRDANRSSSRLTERGDTSPEDRI